MHASVAIAPHQRQKLERLCRYVSRPPVAGERLALTGAGPVRYTLKTPYRDGTTHLVLEPLWNYQDSVDTLKSASLGGPVAEGLRVVSARTVWPDIDGTNIR